MVWIRASGKGTWREAGDPGKELREQFMWVLKGHRRLQALTLKDKGSTRHTAELRALSRGETRSEHGFKRPLCLGGGEQGKRLRGCCSIWVNGAPGSSVKWR